MASEHHGVVRFGGLPVPGASVTAMQGDKKLNVVTDADGAYAFPDLADGVWTIEVEMLCFAPIKQDVNVGPGAVGPGAAGSVWDLKLLSMDEIRAAAAAGPPLALPATGTRLSVLTPGVPATEPATPAPPKSGSRKTKAKTPAPPSTPSAYQRSDVNATAAGANATAGSPGDSAAQPPGDLNQSAIDAFAINGSQNNGAASPFSQSQAFGNSRGGGRSLYNGNLGFLLGNSALDAQNFSLTGQQTPKPAYNHLQGMGVLGGPLQIPHLIGANSAPFFLIAYQLMRNRNATTQTTRVPTMAEREGTFAQPVLDPDTGSPFPGNAVPASRLSPQAAALLRFYPLPNFNNALYNYQTPTTNITDQDSVQSRVTKSIGRFNQVFGTFAYENTRSLATNLFQFHDATALAGIDTTISWQHRFSQRLFTTTKFEFNRLSTRVSPNFANRENVSGQAGITGNNQDPVNWGPPNLSFSSGIASLFDAQQAYNRNQTASISDSTFWNHAPHNITFGGDFRRQQLNQLSQQNARGAFAFTGATTGYDFADFLLGIPDTSSIAFGNADKYFRDSLCDAYITDDWRLSPGFTLNAGVRWEYGAPITELYGRLVNLDIAPGFTAVAPVVADSPVGPITGRKYPDSLVQPDKHAFEPGVGIAWRPISGSSLVVRAGYGVTYNTSVYQSIAQQMAQQAPLSKSLSVQNTLANPLTLSNGFNASPNTTVNTFSIDPDFRVGYAQTWQASVQRDLPAAMILTMTYLGIKGTRAQQEFLPNTYPLGGDNPCPACPSGYTYLTSNGNSTREAGQLQLRRRLHNGITATLQYTYSKSIDDAALGGKGQGTSAPTPGVQGQGGQGPGAQGTSGQGTAAQPAVAPGTAVVAQNWLNLSGERGRSSFDQRHLLNLQAQYSTGVGIGGGTLLGGWRGALFKEWTVATQITAGSGLPLTPVYFAAVPGTGVTGSYRPDYTGAPLYAAPPGLFLNPAAVRTPAAGQWGDAGRNSITGPAQFSLNASLARTFRLSDRLNMDLRLDSVNALNHVTFQSWNTTVNPQFGLPTAANAMRTVQLYLRLRF
jgi:trimeric autotransporter adhesin